MTPPKAVMRVRIRDLLAARHLAILAEKKAKCEEKKARYEASLRPVKRASAITLARRRAGMAEAANLSWVWPRSRLALHDIRRECGLILSAESSLKHWRDYGKYVSCEEIN